MEIHCKDVQDQEIRSLLRPQPDARVAVNFKIDEVYPSRDNAVRLSDPNIQTNIESPSPVFLVQIAPRPPPPLSPVCSRNLCRPGAHVACALCVWRGRCRCRRRWDNTTGRQMLIFMPADYYTHVTTVIIYDDDDSIIHALLLVLLACGQLLALCTLVYHLRCT